MAQKVKVIHCNLCEEKFESEDNARDHYYGDHSAVIPYTLATTLEWI